jgi:DNA-binding FrmR family transcriptional regulator
MSETPVHATHPDLVKRLKRADGHLRHVIELIEQGAACSRIAMQLQAVEKAITSAKRTLIHDHMDHCLGAHGASAGVAPEDLAEFRQIAKYL